jgi:hypothetical protein
MVSEIDWFYGIKQHSNKKACILVSNNTDCVEFYENDVMISVWKIADKSREWSISVAENFCNGILKIEPWEFKFDSY